MRQLSMVIEVCVMREVLTEQWRCVWDSALRQWDRFPRPRLQARHSDGGLAGLICEVWRPAQRQLIISASPYQNKHSSIRSTRRQTSDLHSQQRWREGTSRSVTIGVHVTGTPTVAANETAEKGGLE